MFQVIAEVAKEVASYVEEINFSEIALHDVEELIAQTGEVEAALNEVSVGETTIGETAQQLEANSTFVKDGHTFITDDNGKVFKRDNEIMPSSEYEVNGYKYTTDELSRTVSAEGKLKLEPETGRNRKLQKEAGGEDRLETDDGGHLIGRQFGGIGKIDLVPQDSVLNKGAYNRLETRWANAVKNGDEVFVKIEPQYTGDSFRPDSFKVSYSINGEKFKTNFTNTPNYYARNGG